MGFPVEYFALELERIVEAAHDVRHEMRLERIEVEQPDVVGLDDIHLEWRAQVDALGVRNERRCQQEKNTGPPAAAQAGPQRFAEIDVSYPGNRWLATHALAGAQSVCAQRLAERIAGKHRGAEIVIAHRDQEGVRPQSSQ